MKNKQYSRMAMIGHFLKGSWHFLLLSMVFAFLVSILELYIPQIIKALVDNLIGTEPLTEGSVMSKLAQMAGGVDYLREHLGLVAGAVAVMALFIAVFRYGSNQCSNIGAQKLQEKMREDLFEHLQTLPFSWYSKNKTGDIIQRCTSDVSRVSNFVATQLFAVFRIVILIAMSLFFMFRMDVRLTLIACVTIPIIILYSLFFHRKFETEFEKCDTNEGILSSIAQENLTGVRVVRAFGREEYERERFEKQNNFYTGLWINLMKLMGLFWGIGDLISGLQVMMVLVLGTVYCVGGTLTAGTLVAFISYNSMLIWPVRSLGRIISEMSKSGVSLDRLRYIMNAESEEDAPDALTPDLRGDIVFDHVSFAYDQSVPILDDVSVTIPQGTTLGILGSTGSGKTTLVQLLNRLYELPEGSGDITIGGVNTRQIQHRYLRKNIGMVLQEPFLFSRTLGENIKITNPNMGDEAMTRAAQIACIHDSITGFTNGYETMVGERGVTLSGGQKQRTAIARMLTQNAPIMVFDDSLSAVDAKTDVAIRTQLKENLGDATTIIISHRISTLMDADQILVLHDGKVVENGTPAELLTHEDGTFRRIYNLQTSL